MINKLLLIGTLCICVMLATAIPFAVMNGGIVGTILGVLSTIYVVIAAPAAVKALSEGDK